MSPCDLGLPLRVTRNSVRQRVVREDSPGWSNPFGLGLHQPTEKGKQAGKKCFIWVEAVTWTEKESKKHQIPDFKGLLGRIGTRLEQWLADTRLSG